MRKESKKQKLIDSFNADAYIRAKWRKRNKYYYDDLNNLYSFLIYRGSKVLELGCGNGDLLEFLRKENDCKCTGIDFSIEMISVAKKKFKNIRFIEADAEKFSIKEKFDVIILSDFVGAVPDVQKILSNIRHMCTNDTRIILNLYSFLWEPVLTVCRNMKLISNIPPQNWLSTDDICNILNLTDFEVIKKGNRLLLPKYVPLISTFMNKYIAKFPLMRKMCLYNYVVARPINLEPKKEKSVTVIIPAMNEKGNIENAVKRTPHMGKSTEIIFIEGGSKDGTYDEIVRVAKKYSPNISIKYAKQTGKGKGDAVRKGYDMASGDILMILDADLTVPPEDLPKFYEAIVSNKGEFINGTRLVYPMEDQAMRTLNLIGNKGFSIIFTWILDQRFKDTLCGTKVLTKNNYEKLKKNRLYFGDFDPFGDFDLIFGASKLNLRTIEVPVRYGARTYGSTNIQRFKHGWLLIKMSFFAMKKIKFK